MYDHIKLNSALYLLSSKLTCSSCDVKCEGKCVGGCWERCGVYVYVYTCLQVHVHM